MISKSGLNVCHEVSKTRSQGQMKGKPYEHSVGHIFDWILIKLDENVSFNGIYVKFVYGSFGFKE